MTTKTLNEITTFPYALGWQGRQQAFRIMEAVYGKEDAVYVVFKYTEKKNFEPTYKQLNTKKEALFVSDEGIEQLMDCLKIYHFDKNTLYEKEGVIKLKLTQTTFENNIIRQPKTRVVEGEFYQFTKEEFEQIPFDVPPITEKRGSIWVDDLVDSVELTEVLKNHFNTHCIPIQTTKATSILMKYRPIIVEDVKMYVPKDVNEQALLLAAEHDLTNLEFNFLNYFYQTGKALRNDVGQLFFDENSKGIGWGHSRDWVKKKMARLIELGLVKFESRHDCRDPRYTSWYFYDANKNLDTLKHDF